MGIETFKQKKIPTHFNGVIVIESKKIMGKTESYVLFWGPTCPVNENEIKSKIGEKGFFLKKKKRSRKE